MANGLDEDDLMFCGMKRVVEAPRNAEADNEAEIRIACMREGASALPQHAEDSVAYQ